MASKFHGRGRALLSALRMASGVVLAECAQEIAWRKKNGTLSRHQAHNPMRQLIALGYTEEPVPALKDLFELTPPDRLERYQVVFRCRSCAAITRALEETDQEEARQRLQRYVHGRSRLALHHEYVGEPAGWGSCYGLLDAIGLSPV